MFNLHLITVLTIISTLQAANLPTYLTRCALKDSKLNQCFKKNANLAIRDIAKGDIHYDIPSAIPLRYEAPIVKRDNNVEIIVSNLEIHGLEFSKVTDVQVDFEKGSMSMVLEAPGITAYAHCGANGNVLGFTVSAHDEILNEKFVGATIGYSKNFTLNNIDGEKFIRSLSRKVEMKVKNQYNAFLSDFGDIKEQRSTCQENLPQVIEGKIGDYIDTVFEGLAVRVPVKDFF